MLAVKTPFLAVVAAMTLHARNDPNFGCNLRNLPSKGAVTTRKYRYNPVRKILGSDVVYEVTQVDLDAQELGNGPAQRTFTVTIEEIHALAGESGA